MGKKKLVQLFSVFLLIGLSIGSVYGAFLTYKSYVEIYGEKYPLGIVELDIRKMEPIEGGEAREDYIGEIRVWTYSNDSELILQLVQVSQIVYNFRSFTVKVCMPLDVIFVVDEGNMELYVDTVKGQLAYLVDVLPLMDKMPVRFGVVGFRDFPAETRQLSLTDDYAAVKTFIDTLAAATTVPSPQSHYLGLQAALDDFEANSAIDIDKLVIFISDAEAGRANSPSFDEARIVADALAERGIKIHAVLCGPDESPENAQLEYYAHVSVGNYIGPQGQHRIVAGSTSNPTWIVKLTPITPFDSFRFKLNSSPPCEQEGFYTLSVFVDFYASAIPWHDFFLVELTAHLEKAEKPPPPPSVDNSPCPEFLYVGRDLTTQGDWIEGGYGECGYALPYTEIKRKQVATGETTGIGEPSHEYWWREPWGVPGEKYYPYEDYLGGTIILEYEVAGPEGPPRALVDADSMYYRPSWYCNDSSVAVTLNGIAGDYRVSVYLLDWDAPSGGARRRARVNVTSSGAWDAVALGTIFTENFAAGAYAIFEVDSDGTIQIEVTNIGPADRYAVIAGIFLDSISGPITGVTFVGTDRITKGNWRPTYGNDYYLLPGFNVPVSGAMYKPIVKTHDETNIPLANYDVSEGACQFAADIARTYGAYPYTGQYAAYEWLDNSTATALDTRMLMYPVDKIYHGYPPTPLDRRYFGVWDSGELNGLLSHFMMNVDIPDGEYIFSIYAADFEKISRSETIEIWDDSMTTLLDSQYITGGEINNGIYVQWFVRGPRTISVKVIADPGNLNSFVNGIFLNCATCP